MRIYMRIYMYICICAYMYISVYAHNDDFTLQGTLGSSPN